MDEDVELSNLLHELAHTSAMVGRDTLIALRHPFFFASRLHLIRGKFWSLFEDSRSRSCKSSKTPGEEVKLNRADFPRFHLKSEIKDLGCVLMTNMLTPIPLRSVPYQKVIVNGAQCSKSNGKNNKKILRFLFFELSSKIGVIFSEK